ncbi:PAS domain-containing protein [Microvirga subterranea]|uniref:PAS domain-containing protein n=2 Tax=Microvirga subterranea TaxID=186651 RepID=A0A370HIU8_9HYPH|nr:PAS domain-containing protein [Microvirga subterranea]
MPPGEVEPDAVPAEDVRATLQRLFLEGPFQRSPQLRAFLSYVVDVTLAGRGSFLKSYSIATQALGRPVDFDPTTDAIVRVEAKRLRQVLAGIYADPACGLPVRIEIPVGRYEPVFHAAASATPDRIVFPPDCPVIGDRPRCSRPVVQGDGKLRAALAAARVVAWEFDPATGLVAHSDHARCLLGVDPGPAPEFQDLIHADDRERVVAGFGAALRTGGPFEQAFRMLRPDGCLVQVLARGDVVQVDPGQVPRLAGLLIEMGLA